MSHSEGAYENDRVGPTVTDMRMTDSQRTGEAAASSTGSKVRADRVALLVLSALLAAAAVVIYRLSFEHFQAKKNLQILKDECEAMKKHLTGNGSCNVSKPEPGPTCDSGWEQHIGRCYYFSNDTMNWTQSRSDCKGRGADLVLIDSEEEQWFLTYRVERKMNNFFDMFWIGLTDAEKEGTWLWVDGSALNESLSFWFNTEPNNWIIDDLAGEQCASIGRRETYQLKCWFDRACKIELRRVCEKAAEHGRQWLTHV